MAKRYSYLPIETVTFGEEAITHLSATVDALEANKVAVITTQSLVDSEGLRKLQRLLGERYAGSFCGAAQHTPASTIIDLSLQVRGKDVDALVSFGGGSVIDSTKALSLVLAEDVNSEDQLYEYAVQFTYPDQIHIPSINNETLPHLSVPTTLSAAEFSDIAGITNSSRRVKELYMDEKLTPRHVFLDPELTIGTPMWLWLSSGIRAVDHAVETIYARNNQPIADALAQQALVLLNENLPKCKNDPTNMTARLNCQIASWMSFFGVINVMLGLCHGIGHQIGAHCNVPHGYTSCTMLPHVMRYSLPATQDRQKRIALALGVDVKNLSLEDAASLAPAKVEQLISELELPTRLRDLGVTEDHFDPIATDALEDMVVASSPQPVKDKQTIIELLREAW